MTKDEILEMAKQVNMRYREIEDEFYSSYADGVYLDELIAFAKLVAAKERDACAKACEKIRNEMNNWPDAWEGTTAETKFVRMIGETVSQPFIDAIRDRDQP